MEQLWFWVFLIIGAVRGRESEEKKIEEGRLASATKLRERDEWDAKWGRGPLAGRTGNPFIDKPFFNPWAPGGKFNKK